MSLLHVVAIGFCSVSLLALLGAMRNLFFSEPPSAGAALVLLVLGVVGGLVVYGTLRLMWKRAVRTLQLPSPQPSAIRGSTGGGVYLLKAGEYYKIGCTKDFGTRLRSIKLQLPFEWVEVHRIAAADHLVAERYWHERFASKRRNGEWFVLSEADVAEFCRHQAM